MADTDGSILDDVKKLLNLPVDDESFDSELIVLINSAFGTLHQLGVGPLEEFEIADKSTKWSAFIADTKHIQSVKSAVWIDVKLVFDPPPTSFGILNYEKRLEQLQWRLRAEADKTGLLPTLVVLVVDPEIL